MKRNVPRKSLALPAGAPIFDRMMYMRFSHSRIAQAVVTCLFVCLAPLATAADRGKVEAFLEVTGFDAALESIKYSASSAPDLLGVDAGDFGISWTQMTKQVFDVAQMREMAIDILEQTLSEDLLTHAAAFYATDLGQRLVEVENASHLDPDDEAKQLGGEQLVADMVEEGSPRLEIFKRMNRAVDSSGTSVRAIQQVQMRFLLAASAAGVIELRLDADELAAMFKAQEGDMRLAVAQSALATAAYVYRDFSDEDVEAYTLALESEDMKTVYELMNAVQYEIMANRFEVLATKLAGLQPAQDI